jgi:hypothetical protein
VGEGRPAEIAAMPGSFTGQFLRHYYTASDGRLEQVDLGDKAVLADYAAYESAESNLETEAKQEFVPRKKKTGVPEAIKSVPVKRAAAAKAKAPAAKKTAVKKAATRKKKTGTL